MYTPEKAKWPPASSRQFAGSSGEGSVSPDPLDVSYDKYGNEIASDRPYHQDTTPGEGKFGFNNPSRTSISGAQSQTGRQYADDWQGGYRPYGVTVQDKGQNPGASVISVDNSRADRGKES